MTKTQHTILRGILIIPASVILIIGLLVNIEQGQVWVWGWIAFFGVFAFFEGRAIKARRIDLTLTHVVGQIFGVKTWFRDNGSISLSSVGRTVALWGALSWLFLHFVSGGVV